MKGLLIKDSLLLRRNNRSLLTLILVCVVMGFSLGENVPFILCYTATVFGVLALGTISYDEFDNGYPFLMSLPVERKTYAKEKFVFCILAEIIGLAVGLLVCVLFSTVRGGTIDMKEALMMIIVALPVLIMAMSVLIFIQLKYGSEKGRLMMFVIYGVILAVGALIAKFSGSLHLDEKLSGVTPAMGAAVLLCIAALFIFIMLRLSIRAVQKKEY